MRKYIIYFHRCVICNKDFSSIENGRIFRNL